MRGGSANQGQAGVMSTRLAFHRWVLIAVMIVAGCAVRASSGGTTIIALNRQDPNSFFLHGEATLDAGTSSVQVNSNANPAALFQGSYIDFIAGEVNVVGSYDERGAPRISMPIHEGQPYLPDPLANLPAPSFGSPTGTKITGSGTFYPGYYPQGLELQSGNNITLMPGMYVLDNGFNIIGGTLHGQGVMFYIRSGAVNDRGNANLFLAPATEGPFRGITFFQASNNTSIAALNGGSSYTGFGDSIGIGTLYFPAAKLQLGGTGDIYMNGIIADKVEVFGTGVKKVIVPEPSLVSLLVVACAGLMMRRFGTRG
jgi:hypothetical protein